RRHTRSKRDWSSDVCSSDLHSVNKNTKKNPRQTRRGPITTKQQKSLNTAHQHVFHHHVVLKPQIGTLTPHTRLLDPTKRRRLIEIGRASCREGVRTTAPAAG